MAKIKKKTGGAAAEAIAVVETGATISEIVVIPISMLREHPKNYELYGQTTVSAELVRSIRERGVLQPLIIREVEDEYRSVCYEIIAGHRRNLASSEAGLLTVPCTVKQYENDEEALADLLQSNIQRIKSRRELKNEFLLAKQNARQLLQALRKQGRLSDSKYAGLLPSTNVDGVVRVDDLVSQDLKISARQVEERTIVYDDEYLQKQLDKFQKSEAWTIAAETEFYTAFMEVRNECEAETITDSAGAKKLKALVKSAQAQLLDAAGGVKTKKKAQPDYAKKAADLFVNADMYFSSEMTDAMTDKEKKDFGFDYIVNLAKALNRGKVSIEVGGETTGRISFVVKKSK